jgi:hypothetical protein
MMHPPPPRCQAKTTFSGACVISVYVAGHAHTLAVRVCAGGLDVSQMPGPYRRAEPFDESVT